MDTMLTRLRYASTFADDPKPDELALIVAWSAASNSARGITGILAVDGRQVMQVLEGPPEEIDALFLRISADPRHYGIVVIDHHGIPATSFADWGMVRKSMTSMLLTVDGW